MTYRKEISFPMEPTKEDMKKLRRQVARDKFGVVDGGKQKEEGKGKEKES